MEKKTVDFRGEADLLLAQAEQSTPGRLMISMTKDETRKQGTEDTPTLRLIILDLSSILKTGE